MCCGQKPCRWADARQCGLVLQVETLKMGWCNVGPDDGAKAVADLLMFNNTIATLDLRGNGLMDAGAPFTCGSVGAHQCRCRSGRHVLLVTALLRQSCRLRSIHCLPVHDNAVQPSHHNTAPGESVLRLLILLQVQSTWGGPSRSTRMTSSQIWTWATTRSRTRAHALWLRCTIWVTLWDTVPECDIK